ncbi:MAG TPA: glycosyltransferase family 9 protein [Pyrinomonadaceae bacterium]|jgi:ADP-heptose:LPS heptosyltransferase
MVHDRASNPGRILVFRIGQLGDTIVALPAFWMLRAAYPAASITLLTNSAPNHVGAVAANDVLPDGLFDNVISYPSNTRGFAALAQRLALANRIRRGRFERAYYLMPRNRTPAQISRDLRFFRLSGIKDVAGVRFHQQNLLEFPIPVPTPETSSEVDFLVEMLRSEGIDPGDKSQDLLRLSKDERQAAARWLCENCLVPDSEIIVAVAPGSNWPSKTWASDRFESVISRLMSQFNIFPVVVGGPQDRTAGDRLIDSWGRGANAAGRLTVRESAALLERCSLFLGNDTGTMHLAAAVGTPCVAVFSAVDWIGKWAPFGGQRNRILRARIDCEGCRLQACPYGNKCLDLVSVDETFAACVDLLSRGSRSDVLAAYQV